MMGSSVQYFETAMQFNELIGGVEKYGIHKKEYAAIWLYTDISIIATYSDTLIKRFGLSARFKKIALDKDEFLYRIGDNPVKGKAGNFNLFPLLG